MREIKFRAWDKEKKQLREVTGINWYDEYLWVDETPMTGDRLPIEGTPLMQFIGLKDKNGKETFSEDIVSDGINPPFVVDFWNWDMMIRLYQIEFEIIGNACENPELLLR